MTKPGTPSWSMRAMTTETPARSMILHPGAELAVEHPRCRRTVHPHGAQRVERRHLHVLAEVKLLQTTGDLLHVCRRDVEQDEVARLEQVQVAQHPSLRRQPGGVTAAAGRERRGVVGEKTVQESGAIATRDGNLRARRNGANGSACMNGCVIVGRGHPRCFEDARVADTMRKRCALFIVL
jgi:hypothetical protein